MTVEELQEQILSLKEQLKTKDNLEKELNDTKAKIVSLQEHNQKLFLKLTENKPTEKETETESNISLEDIANKFMEV